jgi:hypothetical protein
MGSINRSPIFDAGKNPPRKRMIMIGGVPTEERIPNGNVERWVDSDGNVVYVQMAQPAQLTNKKDSSARKREKLRARGWIEHHLCPKKSGAMFEAPGPAQACADGSYGRGHACQHVESVVKARQLAKSTKEQEKLQARFAEKFKADDMEQRKLAAQERTAEALIVAAKQMTGKKSGND